MKNPLTIKTPRVSLIIDEYHQPAGCADLVLRDNTYRMILDVDMPLNNPQRDWVDWKSMAYNWRPPDGSWIFREEIEPKQSEHMYEDMMLHVAEIFERMAKSLRRYYPLAMENKDG